MENGLHNGLPTNHDRDRSYGQLPNGSVGETKAIVNGDTAMDQLQQPAPPGASRMNDLPDEIQHITQNLIPLGVLVSRLAQRTHNALQERIMALAKIQVPGASPVNGNTPYATGLPGDVSPENLAKKTQLLKFIQETHARWVKALVITAWSRKAEPVSKLIDLMGYLEQQKALYANNVDYMINIKRDLTFARLPNPDLKTALQVLSTGDAPWMADLGYIEPLPMSPKEQLKWIENLNTLLSLRLNLDDHDKIPYHFQDYSIASGRVTFKVPGEFEIDLTIADEDFEKQYWFVDFRLLVEPAPAGLSDGSWEYLAKRVNEVLGMKGLKGCYEFLHEFVLTHKITEYVRQAFELSKGQWVDTLKIERLNRAMAIQYWLNRSPPDGPKSWIIVGVHSGNKPGVPSGPSSTSHLTLRWFRDNQEVKDVAISLDDPTVSTERLLKKVIGKHIGHILTAIHSKLKTKRRFVDREASLALKISEDEPVDSTLKMQLGYGDYLTVRIAPTTGFFAVTPQTRITWFGERRLNWQTKNPTEEGPNYLEQVRYHYMSEAMSRRGRSLGWDACKQPVKTEDVKPLLNTREAFQAMWFRRRGWAKQWYLMLSLSLSGDRWWLIEVSHEPARIATFTNLPLSSCSPHLTDKFFADLTVFTAGMISHIIDLRSLHNQKIKHAARDAPSDSLPPNIKIPAVFIRLSSVLNMRQSTGSKKTTSWAVDFVQIMFKGIRNSPYKVQPEEPEEPGNTEPVEEHRLNLLVDARFKVADPERFSLLQRHVERDVAFNKELGVFALRLRAEAGRTILDALAHRVRAIERLVDCIDAIRQSDRDVRCEDITLNQVTFTYSDQPKASLNAPVQQNIQRWRASVVLYEGRSELELERGNPHLRVISLFRRLINSNLRFKGLPYFLSTTLPVVRALDSIEAAWQGPGTKNTGRVDIHLQHLDWFNIRYTLPGPGKGGERRLLLLLKLRCHRGEVMWHIQRQEPGPGRKQPNDAFTQALSKVWGVEGRDWRSLIHSAAATTDGRVEALMKAIDESIRSLATQSPSMTRQALSKMPQQHTQQQQQQQRNQNPNQVVNQKMMAAAAAANKARPQPARPQQHQQRQQPGQGQVVILDD